MKRIGDGYWEIKLHADAVTPGDVYKMIVAGFSNVWCSAFYILAILMLFSHLRHGVQSIFQTVGADSRKIRPFYNFVAIAYGAVICLGFISVPVSVLLGIIK